MNKDQGVEDPLFLLPKKNREDTRIPRALAEVRTLNLDTGILSSAPAQKKKKKKTLKSVQIMPIVEDKEDPSKKAGTRGGPGFAFQLYELLMASESMGYGHIVSWQLEGMAFKVHNRAALVGILPNFGFKQSKWDSMLRQLSHYGFKRMQHGSNKGGYHHVNFHRDHPEWLEYVSCERTRSKSKLAIKKKSAQENIAAATRQSAPFPSFSQALAATTAYTDALKHSPSKNPEEVPKKSSTSNSNKKNHRKVSPRTVSPKGKKAPRGKKARSVSVLQATTASVPPAKDPEFPKSTRNRLARSVLAAKKAQKNAVLAAKKSRHDPSKPPAAAQKNAAKQRTSGPISLEFPKLPWPVLANKNDDTDIFNKEMPPLNPTSTVPPHLESVLAWNKQEIDEDEDDPLMSKAIQVPTVTSMQVDSEEDANLAIFKGALSWFPVADFGLDTAATDESTANTIASHATTATAAANGMSLVDALLQATTVGRTITTNKSATAWFNSQLAVPPTMIVTPDKQRSMLEPTAQVGTSLLKTMAPLPLPVAVSREASRAMDSEEEDTLAPIKKDDDKMWTGAAVTSAAMAVLATTADKDSKQDDKQQGTSTSTCIEPISLHSAKWETGPCFGFGTEEPQGVSCDLFSTFQDESNLKPSSVGSHPGERLASRTEAVVAMEVDSMFQHVTSGEHVVADDGDAFIDAMLLRQRYEAVNMDATTSSLAANSAYWEDAGWHQGDINEHPGYTPANF